MRVVLPMSDMQFLETAKSRTLSIVQVLLNIVIVPLSPDSSKAKCIAGVAPDCGVIKRRDAARGDDSFFSFPCWNRFGTNLSEVSLGHVTPSTLYIVVTQASST